MDERLLQLTAAALTGIASRPRLQHLPGPGAQVLLVTVPADEIGGEAVELARATLAALERTASTASGAATKRR